MSRTCDKVGRGSEESQRGSSDSVQWMRRREIWILPFYAPYWPTVRAIKFLLYGRLIGGFRIAYLPNLASCLVWIWNFVLYGFAARVRSILNTENIKWTNLIKICTLNKTSYLSNRVIQKRILTTETGIKISGLNILICFPRSNLNVK